MRWALPYSVVVLSLAAALATGTPAPAPKAPPNIVYILLDDLGWTDLGSFGSAFYETPHIDRLATQGMRFTQAYTACTVCSPTRASIMTGKYPARLHITDWIPGNRVPNTKLRIPNWVQHLPLEEKSIARALKAAGYVSASIGKWHLGGPSYFPEKHGFDLNRGGCDKGHPPSYFSPYKIPNLEDGPPGEYLTDRLTQEAIRFIEASQDRPFFLYLPHYAVHKPIQAKAAVIEKYRAKAKPGADHTNAGYAAMIESADDSVGRILARLDELKLSSNTVVILTSDNGGLLEVTSNKPLRDGKGSAYEGGVRVPLIVRWPGVVREGSVCEIPIISQDGYPTLLELAGLAPDPGQILDGQSLVPLLKQEGRFEREALFWHYPHYIPKESTPYSAVRQGDFRLIEFLEDGRLELYNLKTDLGETKNLASSMPEKAEELRKRLADWRVAVGAQMPAINPDYDPKK
jgi:arylsulfatase A-like enzyme